MTNPIAKRPNSVMAWMYRLVPRLPKRLQPERMITLHHVGRRSGEPRMTGLDKVSYDAEADRYFVAAAYGPRSDWWLNVLAEPAVSIEVDGKNLTAQASPVEHDEAVAIMTEFTRDDPRLLRRVCKRVNVDPDDPQAISKVVDVNPLMAFQVVTD